MSRAYFDKPAISPEPVLMENIVRLDEYRKSRRPARAARAPESPRFFCLSCDTDQFKLYASGSVHCASCGALIRNIGVSDSSTQ
jgi:hypothetical protein